jgi:hypothetical protein
MSLTKSAITSYVTNKFINSQYIKNRTFPAAEVKYFPEEVEFWVNQTFNSSWSLTMFDTEFDLTYSVNHNRSLSAAQNNDYVGQTFLIDKVSYPNGMYISSISIFVAKEGSNFPITLDVRALVNGIPGPVIPMSKVTKMGINDVSDAFKWNSTVSAEDQVSKRDFVFDFPVYLSPGYYCFTLKTSSSDYSIYIAENGKGNISYGAIVTNPYLGDFIYSGQGESWVIDPTKDLCFIIKQAIFKLGDKNLYLNLANPNNIEFDYDALQLTTKTIEVNKVAYISDSTVVVKDAESGNPSTLSILPNSNINVPSHSQLNTGNNSIPFTLTLTNTDKNLTPIIDLERTGVALIKNYIDPYSIELSETELTASNGLAFAKYITKPITLNEDFDADGITVFVDVNRPTGASIEVFYRILNRYDYSVAFDEANWYLLGKKSSATPSVLTSDYVEETYEGLDITYTGANGIDYNSFNQIAIKIVFYSDEASKVPTIKNLRVIATV